MQQQSRIDNTMRKIRMQSYSPESVCVRSRTGSVRLREDGIMRAAAQYGRFSTIITAAASGVTVAAIPQTIQEV